MHIFNCRSLATNLTILCLAAGMTGCGQEPGLYERLDKMQSKLNDAQSQLEQLESDPFIKFGINELNITINEDGFAPRLFATYGWKIEGEGVPPMIILKSDFRLSFESSEIVIEGELEDLIKAGKSDSEFYIELPKFEMKAKDARLVISPKAWYPAFPAISFDHSNTVSEQSSEISAP